MPAVTQLPSTSPTSPGAATQTAPPEWFTPFGIVTNFSEPTRPRVGPPTFIYRGSADEHLRGQSCYPETDILPAGESQRVIMACGCRLVVPWWTLEPIKL